jgi:hypothetical protein
MLEGTLSGTFAAFGTINVMTAGKERTVLAIDENGLSVTNGVLDHTTWHCSGLADFTNGIGQTQGTGKYAGIRGSGRYVDYSGEFRPQTEGTIVSYLTFEGNYRTPATAVAADE